MEVFNDNCGVTSSTRVGGFCLLFISVVFGLLGSLVLTSAPVALPMAQSSLWAGVALLTGGKLSEKIIRK